MSVLLKNLRDAKSAKRALHRALLSTAKHWLYHNLLHHGRLVALHCPLTPAQADCVLYSTAGWDLRVKLRFQSAALAARPFLDLPFLVLASQPTVVYVECTPVVALPCLVFASQPTVGVLHYIQGAMTSGRIPREATMQLSVELSTALTSETAASQLYRDTADASNGAVELAGRAVSAATEQYQSALRLQNMTGQVWGPLAECTCCC